MCGWVPSAGQVSLSVSVGWGDTTFHATVCSLIVFVSICVLCQKQGHLPITMSLATAYELKVSPTGRRSIRKLRQATYTVEFMVCAPVHPVHIASAATSARLEATAAADADHAIERQSDAALQPDVVDLTAGGRADAMDRALDALRDPMLPPQSRASPRVKPFTESTLAVCTLSWTRVKPGLSLKRCKRARVLGSSSIGQVPASAALGGAIHNAISSRARQKPNEQAASVANRLGQLSGPAGSPRVYVVSHFVLLHIPLDSGGVPAPAPARPKPPALERPLPSPLQKMGASALTSRLCDFLFGDEADTDRGEFELKVVSGMGRNFLRGHTVEGSSVEVSEVVGLVLSEWGPEEGPHPDFDSLPLGLQDAVGAWVVSHRWRWHPLPPSAVVLVDL